MKRPDFFIVGAPKCGTTALSEYLRAHPRLFLATPKEPHYFATDLPGLRYITTEEAYHRLFAAADEGHLAVGEASPGYLYSRDALPAIRAYAPAARLIVMLRDPIELFLSHHAQLRYSLFEEEADPATAWGLQEERRAGRRIPAACREPRALLYRDMLALGDQLERLYALFPPQQVLVILYDELRDDAGAVYRRTLAFLGLPDDGRSDFPVVNPHKGARWGWLNRLLHRPPRWALALLRRLAGGPLHDAVVALHGRLKRLNSQRRERAALPPAFRRELAAELRPQVEKLERLLGRDLSHWLAVE